MKKEERFHFKFKVLSGDLKQILFCFVLIYKMLEKEKVREDLGGYMKKSINHH